MVLLPLHLHTLLAFLLAILAPLHHTTLASVLFPATLLGLQLPFTPTPVQPQAIQAPPVTLVLLPAIPVPLRLATRQPRAIPVLLPPDTLVLPLAIPAPLLTATLLPLLQATRVPLWATLVLCLGMQPLDIPPQVTLALLPATLAEVWPWVCQWPCPDTPHPTATLLACP